MDSSKSLAPSRTIDLRGPEDSQQQRNQNYVEGQREEQQQGEQEAQGPLQVLIYLWEVWLDGLPSVTGIQHACSEQPGQTACLRSSSINT